MPTGGWSSLTNYPGAYKLGPYVSIREMLLGAVNGSSELADHLSVGIQSKGLQSGGLHGKLRDAATVVRELAANVSGGTI